MNMCTRVNKKFKGALRYGAYKVIDVKNNLIHLSPSGSPQFHVLVEIVFLLIDSEICIFLEKSIIHKQHCAQLCKGSGL